MWGHLGSMLPVANRSEASSGSFKSKPGYVSIDFVIMSIDLIFPSHYHLLAAASTGLLLNEKREHEDKLMQKASCPGTFDGSMFLVHAPIVCRYFFTWKKRFLVHLN